MGNAASDGSTSAASIFDAAQTSALDKIVSEQSYMMSDSVWVTFFTLDQPLLDMPPATLQQFFRPYAHNFARNTVRSGNFRMLIRHVTRSVRYLSPPRHHADTIVTTTTTVLATESFHVINVLCVVRHFIKHFIEHNCDVVTLFATEGNSTSSSNNDIAVDFLDALLLLLFDAPTEDTYDLHLEGINLLLVLASSTAYPSTSTSMHPTLLDVFMTHASASDERGGGRPSQRADDLVKRLLLSYLDQLPAPRMESAAAIAATAALPRKIWIRVLLVYIAFIYLPYLIHFIYFVSFIASTTSSWDNVVEFFSEIQVFPLADRSALLLLVLVTASNGGGGNPFRKALATLADRDESRMLAHSLPFSHVVAVLGRNIHIELHATLLYHALLLNPSFRDALCRPVDVDHFVLPLLEAIYIHTLSPPRLYTLLAVLLHLSENPPVVQTLHQSQVQDHQTWYQERYLCDLSAASVGVLVLCRVLKANLSVLHDSLVQSMAMALLWNVMQFAKNLHPTATQSLVKLLAHAAKKEQLLRPSPDEAAAYLATARDLLLCIQLGCTPRLLPANAQLVLSFCPKCG
ncbi:hypothetical protein, variant 7 [Aphanomyces astaci]|uniref:Dymeclin n=1 Tax=Aphanomyces astaci TaxID=112090 RepID=W4G5B9_APHAT|nr:hypothetical protein, variant 7 [Aphanomyces astaci]ETV74486.1 hypothetical protein, variant 7 [Aphanomyces astaci]|eukprot:XP_009836149.1 hypothetical protein, variant 7 [Aphanomyces astaci]